MNAGRQVPVYSDWAPAAKLPRVPVRIVPGLSSFILADLGVRSGGQIMASRSILTDRSEWVWRGPKRRWCAVASPDHIWIAESVVALPLQEEPF